MAKKTEAEIKKLCFDGLSLIWISCCKGQIKPDGNSCAICEDIDHQAFECPFNIFLVWERAVKNG